MAKKVGDIDETIIKQIREDSIGLLNDLDSIGKSISSSLIEVSKATGESTEAYKESFNAAKALGDAIAKIDSKTLASKKQQTTFEDKVRKAQEEAIKLEAKASRLRSETVNLSAKQAREAFRVARAYEDGADKLREQAKQAARITDQFEKLNEQTKVFDDAAEFFKEIPGLGVVFGEFQKASDAAREAASEGGNSFVAGAKQLGGAFTKIASAFTLGLLIEGLGKADERMVSLGRNLNKSADDSKRLMKGFNAAARGMEGLTGGELQAAAESFATSLGTTAVASIDTTKELAAQVKFLGLSADEANDLEKYSAATGQNVKDTGNAIRGEVILSNYRNKTAISFQAITKDVAKASAAIKLSTAGIGGNITQAAIASKKLGLDLSGVDKIAGSLLNFEDSIAAELEAELLTGQDLNLERARGLALNNDLEGVAKEIGKQGITSEKFSRMNRVQQEATAKALGMSRDEMASMFQEQKALAAYSAKDKTDLEASVKKELEQVDILKKQGKLEEAKNLEREITKKLGNEELERQLKNQSVAEKQKEATEMMAESMDKLVDLIKPVSAAFSFIAHNAELIVKALLLLTGASMIAKFGKLAGAFRGLGGIMGRVTSAATSAAATAGGGAGATVASTAGGAAKQLSPKQIAAGFGGKAAKEALKTGGMEAAQVAGAGGQSIAASATKGGGGFFSNLFKSAKSLVSKLNPLTAIKGAVKSAGGIGGFLKSALKKIPGLNTILTGFFAYNDIKSLIENPIGEDGQPLSKDKLSEEVGKIVAGGLGGILGGVVGTAVGGPLGTIVGSLGGEWLFKNLLGLFPEAAAGLGEVIIPMFGTEKKMAEGGIVTGPTRALVGEAGSEAVIPLDKFYEKLDELIHVVKSGGNVYLDATKVGTAMNVGTYKLQ